MKLRRAGRLLAAPAVAYVALLCVAPMLIVENYSFRVRDVHGAVKQGYTFDAWSKAVGPRTLRIVSRSLLLALGVTAATLVVGYPCALALAAQPAGRRKMLVLAIAFPLVTSMLLRIYGWLNLLPLSWKGTFISVGLVMAVNYLPFMLLPLLRSLERRDANIGEAALDLGATPWQAFWRVTWPLTRPGMWAGAALVFIPCCGEYLTPYFIGQGKVTVIGGWIVQEMELRNWPYAAACAMWLVAVVMVPIVGSLARRRE